jgi:hypothetical protein
MQPINSVSNPAYSPPEIFPGDIGNLPENKDASPPKSFFKTKQKPAQTPLIKKVSDYFHNLALAFFGLPSQPNSSSNVKPSQANQAQIAYTNADISQAELKQLANSIIQQEKINQEAQNIRNEQNINPVSAGLGTETNALYG